jgi:hypothetical protein
LYLDVPRQFLTLFYDVNSVLFVLTPLLSNFDF